MRKGKERDGEKGEREGLRKERQREGGEGDMHHTFPLDQPQTNTAVKTREPACTETTNKDRTKQGWAST